MARKNDNARRTYEGGRTSPKKDSRGLADDQPITHSHWVLSAEGKLIPAPESTAEET